MKKFIVILLLCVFCFACATLDDRMQSWVGDSIDDVTASWGAPESQMNRADGGSVYTWRTTSGNAYGVNTCTQSFVTNAEGTIVSWSYNNCRKR